MHPSNRYLARSNTLTRGKRVLDSKENEDGQPEPKRPKVPALASVIVEALKVDNLQKICSSLEPILRRVVSEEVERALAKLGPARVTGRSSPKRIEGPDGRNLQLHFKTKLSLPLFTGGKIEGDQGAAIHVVLIDANTGQAIYTGPESAVKLDVVVLEGDFNNEDDDNWTQEDFESHVVKEREGKRPLLTGDLQVTLKEGVGTLGDLTFTDNSSWIRSRKFRLGLKVASGYCDGIRIREAKTEAFGVKDHRGELYKKHYPPALKDEVWRLEKIGKDGSFHKRLNKAGINTVEQFLQLVVQNQQKLREILGSGMSNKMWDILVEHAKTCVLSGKHYVYYTDDTRSVGIIFDNIYELRGLIAGDKFYPVESLPDNEKIYVDSMMKKAYDNWTSVIEYDGEVLYKQSSKSASQSRSQMNSSTYLNPFEQNVSRSLMPPPMSSDHPPTTHGMIVSESTDSSGHDDNYASNYPPSRILSLHPHSQYENLSFIPENQIVSSSQQIEVANNVGRSQGPSQSSGFEFPHIDHIHQPNLNSSDDWAHQRNNEVDDFFSAEEEIRSRSNEMLANEDMQNLLRVINMNGSSVCMNDDYIYSSYLSSPLPSFTFDEDRSRPSGKAVVGWLKLKAALRWGIFIRKKAAEKRAQLIELDD